MSSWWWITFMLVTGIAWLFFAINEKAWDFGWCSGFVLGIAYIEILVKLRKKLGGEN